jgi:uncharacterized protein (TIGR02186 family)
MNKRAACFSVLLIVLMIAGLSSSSLSAPTENLSLKTTPSSLEIRESFQGAPLTVSANIPKGATAVVEISGEAHENVLLRKGRRGGLWMSVGQVKVTGAPSLYLLMSSTPGLSIASGAKPLFGYEALKQRMKFSGSMPKGGESMLFEHFIKLKESEGLYGVFPDSLKIGQATGDPTPFQGTVMIPNNIAPGTYTISLTVLNAGKPIDRQAVKFPVEMKGLPALLASLAHTKAFLYGLLAVIIAIVTGFVMGFLFKGKTAH